MARKVQQGSGGFPFTYTDINTHLMPGKDAVHDALAWDDLDGDGVIDLIGISTASGNYEDTDHEVVGMHVPTGNVVWRALRGEVSKKLSLVNGVLICSSNSAQRLRGLDPRTGRELWSKSLDDKLKEDPFDGDDRAPAIAAVGPYAVFECVDDTAHVIDAQTGMTIKQVSGKLSPVCWNLGPYVGFETEDHEGDDCFEAWHIPTGRCIYRAKDASQIRTLHGSGQFAFMHRSEGAPKVNYATKVTVFESTHGQEVGTAWLKKGEDEPRHGDSEYGVIGGFMLAGGRCVFGYRYDEGASYLAQLMPKAVTQVSPLPAPKPGYNFRCLAYCAPVIVSAWQKEKGTPKLCYVGHDPATMAPVWTADDFGGHSQDNAMWVTAGAVLVPRSTDNYYSPTNPAAIVHLDPATGQKVTEYPIESADCVEVHAHFLCGAPEYFSGGTPTAYDTLKRERVL